MLQVFTITISTSINTSLRICIVITITAQSALKGRQKSWIYNLIAQPLITNVLNYQVMTNSSLYKTNSSSELIYFVWGNLYYKDFYTIGEIFWLK